MLVMLHEERTFCTEVSPEDGRAAVDSGVNNGKASTVRRLVACD